MVEPMGEFNGEIEMAVGEEVERVVQQIWEHVECEESDQVADGEDEIELLRSPRDADRVARHQNDHESVAYDAERDDRRDESHGGHHVEPAHVDSRRPRSRIVHRVCKNSLFLCACDLWFAYSCRQGAEKPEGFKYLINRTLVEEDVSALGIRLLVRR